MIVCVRLDRELWLEIEHMEIIFRSEYACQHRRTNSLNALLCIQEEILTPFTKRRYHPILDVETSSLINLALALSATVATQQAIHGPALFAKLDVAAIPFDKVSCIDGTTDEEDNEDDSAHKRMR